MYLQKKKRKNINIVNKPQQWVDFKFDTNTIKNNYNPIISGYDQIKNTHRFNEILLNAAYKNKAEGNWSAVSGRKVAVAGTQTNRDKWDDVTKIPFWGDLRKSERYEQLNKKLLDYPDVNSLIGHSLAGSVVLEKQLQNPYGREKGVFLRQRCDRLSIAAGANRFEFAVHVNVRTDWSQDADRTRLLIR